MPGELFDPIVTTDVLIEATGDTAWLMAMLDSESALTAALVDVGLAPPAAAAAVAAVCVPDRFDVIALGHAGREGGNPAIPLVLAIRAEVGDEHGHWVHRGATSQDIMDTAAMLVVARALPLIDHELVRLASACAGLALRHRSTVMVGRTLLQQALPLPFGLKAAQWLTAVLAARDQLHVARSGLAAQLGGAVGTLAAFGDDGPAVAARFAERVGLPEPLLPWHTSRQRVVVVGSALGVVAGTCAKFSRDVALLMQTEVAEASESGAPGRGGSSSMPHKRNPVGAAAVAAAARRTHALLPVLYGALVSEHERDLGGWQAEWSTLSELLALGGGAAARTAETVVGLEVDVEAMATNLARTGGVLLSERVGAVLADQLGTRRAIELVSAATDARGSTSFAEVLLAEPEVAAVLDRPTLDRLLDHADYLGSSDFFIDRALEAFEANGLQFDLQNQHLGSQR